MKKKKYLRFLLEAQFGVEIVVSSHNYKVYRAVHIKDDNYKVLISFPNSMTLLIPQRNNGISERLFF